MRQRLDAGLLLYAVQERAFEKPLDPVTAWARVADWLAAPVAWIPHPRPKHAELFGELATGLSHYPRSPVSERSPRSSLGA